MSEIPKHYNPAQVEDKWYARWEQAGCFASMPDEREPYTILIPPPNVTGVLHMGHMLNNTIQDLLVRRKRNEGYNALWVPGTDHASIATEAKVVRLLREEHKTTKAEVGREKFLEHAYAWKDKYGGIILQQLRKLGASCDWNRTGFTMDDGYYKDVIHTFIELFKEGLIYRANRIVNWDPEGLTALSDEEVIYKETQGTLYYVHYPMVEGTGHMTIATTRPETILADVAIAVHPDDERYKPLLGKKCRVPLIGREIPIIADRYIDPEFGTGCLKVTPAHSQADFDIVERYNGEQAKTAWLEVIDILDKHGCLTDACGIDAYVGRDRFDIRKQIVQDIAAAGLFEKEETITHSVGHSERTDAVVEPRLSLQWWVDMEHLRNATNAECLVTEVDEEGLWHNLDETEEGVRLIPAKFVNTYRHWMQNIKDWCISRQLWWGHRIPVWYIRKAEGSEYRSPELGIKEGGQPGATGAENYLVAASREEAWAQWEQIKAGTHPSLELRAPYGGFSHPASNVGYTTYRGFVEAITPDDLEQDPDVLDTWFSSWLWPISMFNGVQAPDNEEINYYYPTSTLVTAPEILFFWVARMIMAGRHYRGRVPFRDVYLTGIVRDKQRRKMSKSLGNSPDPLDLIAQYSADGVRMGMLLASPAGNDLLFDESLCEQGRNFTNKVWNAFRLVKGWEERLIDDSPSKAQRVALAWLQARTAEAALELDRLLGEYRLSEALMGIYKLIWDDFCSWALELLKPEGNAGMSRAAYEGTLDAFEQLMLLLSPFMPFISEEIWQTLRPRAEGRYLMLEQLRHYSLTEAQKQQLAEMAQARELTTALRALRAEKGIAGDKELELHIRTQDEFFYSEYLPVIAGQVGLGSYYFTQEAPEGAVSILLRSDEVFIPLEGLIDVAAERERLQKDLEYTRGFLASVEKKLANEKFVQNAKPDVVERERQKQADAQAKIAALQASLAKL